MKSTSNDTISAYDAKTHFSQLLHEVEAGRAFTINRHGKPVARLSPVGAGIQAGRDIEALIREFRALRERVGERLDLRALVEEGRKY